MNLAPGINKEILLGAENDASRCKFSGFGPFSGVFCHSTTRVFASREPFSWLAETLRSHWAQPESESACASAPGCKLRLRMRRPRRLEQTMIFQIALQVACPSFIHRSGRRVGKHEPRQSTSAIIRILVDDKSPYHSSSISTELFDNYPNDFGDVRAGRAKQQAILMAFYLQFGVDHDDFAERFDGFHSKAEAALRRIGVPGPEAPA